MMNLSTLPRPTRRAQWNDFVIVTPEGKETAREQEAPTPTPKKQEGTTRVSLYSDALPANWQQDAGYIWLGPTFPAKGIAAHHLYLSCVGYKLAGDHPGQWLKRCYDRLTNLCCQYDDFRQTFLALHGKTLVCTCTAAMPCHCDVIKDIAEVQYCTQQRELGIQSGRFQLELTQ